MTVSLLLAVAPTAQADAVEPPVCQHIVTGPDIYFGACTDPTAECGLWTYNYGGETCYAPGAGATAGTTAGVVPRAHCERLLYGPDIDQGVCYDAHGQYVDGMECTVWWYSAYSTGQDQCYVPAPPLAASASAAYHDSRPIVCVGDEGPELPGVCYDPDDFDGCDVYAGLGGGNQVCLVPAQNTCSSSTPEWPGVCWTPRQECQLWVGLGRVYCILPVSASTGVSADVAPPRALCQQVLVGPDIDQGVCYDLDGEYVAGMNCIVWWYSTYSTGQDRCYVPYPPGAVALSTASAACVGTGGNTETGVCYDPADGDGCDAHATFHHNNQVCILPETSGIAAASTSTAADPWPLCRDLILGPDILFGVCIDPTRDDCMVWTYNYYQQTCHVPGLPAASASTAGSSAQVAPEPVCQEVYYGLEQFLIVCVDASPSCAVQVITHAGSTCYGVSLDLVVVERCVPLANDLEYEYGVCVDSDRTGCRAWFYRDPGAETCLVP